MLKQIDFKLLILVFTVGAIGGILGSQILLPRLANSAFLSGVAWFSNFREGTTTIINRTEKITITEDQALQDVISKNSPAVVGLRSLKLRKGTANPETLTEGTGFILTSDGLLVTASDLVPENADQYQVIRNENVLEAEIVKRDVKNNLALIRIKSNNLPVVNLGSQEQLVLGSQICLIGVDIRENPPIKFVNLGIVKKINKEISITIKESQLASGSPLFNLQGEVIGLNLVGEDGKIKVISSKIIKEIINPYTFLPIIKGVGIK